MVRVPHMKSRGCRFKYFEEMNSGHLKGAGHLLVWGINNRLKHSLGLWLLAA